MPDTLPPTPATVREALYGLSAFKRALDHAQVVSDFVGSAEQQLGSIQTRIAAKNAELEELSQNLADKAKKRASEIVAEAQRQGNEMVNAKYAELAQINAEIEQSKAELDALRKHTAETIRAEMQAKVAGALG